MKTRILLIIMILVGIISLQVPDLNAQSIITIDTINQTASIKKLARSSGLYIDIDTSQTKRYIFSLKEDTIKFASVESYSSDTDVYDNVDVSPSYNINDIQKWIVYPFKVGNKFNGIIYFKILIGTDGLPIKYLIEYTDSEIMNPVLTKVVMETKFTPAIKSGKAVKI